MGTKTNPSKFDCYAKLEPDEPYFVLMGRDPVACAVVEFWTVLRERLCDNSEGQIEEARECGRQMARYAVALGKEEKVQGALELAAELVK